MLREWVVTATHRQARTFLPPKDYCPLCPTQPGGFPTEVERPTYEIVTFDNKFPSLQPNPPDPDVESTELWPVEPARGVCEVVLYTPDHDSTLAERSVDEIEKLVAVWTDRYAELGKRDFINYVFIFENKGAIIGVTIPHPHGQIYSYPFTPPLIQRELDSSLEHKQRTGRCLMCDILAEEERDGRRIVAQNDSFTAVVPFYARLPYEVHVVPKQHRQCLLELSEGEARDLAAILKVVMQKYDNLWNRSMPYMMVMHQRPTDGGDYSHYHFHLEFYPPYRTPDKLKYMAGTEFGAGVYVNDTLAEEKAAELRASEPVTEAPNG
jgi:UDPglucose--hexose-1-phosphate uridylyltransferase